MIADWFHSQATSGSLVLAVPVALVAGLLSFFSPCVIPLLPGYLSYELNQATAARGAVLAGVYCLGLGVPFVAAAVTYRRALRAIAAIRRHQAWVTRIGGLMLVLVGIALLTGWWDLSVSWLQTHLVNQSSPSL